MGTQRPDRDAPSSARLSRDRSGPPAHIPLPSRGMCVSGPSLHAGVVAAAGLARAQGLRERVAHHVGRRLRAAGDRPRHAHETRVPVAVRLLAARRGGEGAGDRGDVRPVAECVCRVHHLAWHTSSLSSLIRPRMPRSDRRGRRRRQRRQGSRDEDPPVGGAPRLCGWERGRHRPRPTIAGGGGGGGGPAVRTLRARRALTRRRTSSTVTGSAGIQITANARRARWWPKSRPRACRCASAGPATRTLVAASCRVDAYAAGAVAASPCDAARAASAGRRARAVVASG